MRLMGILPSVMRSSFGGGERSGWGEDTPLPLMRGTVDEACLASIALSKPSAYDLLLLLSLLCSIILPADAGRAGALAVTDRPVLSECARRGANGASYQALIGSNCPDGLFRRPVQPYSVDRRCIHCGLRGGRRQEPQKRCRGD